MSVVNIFPFLPYGTKTLLFSQCLTYKQNLISSNNIRLFSDILGLSPSTIRRQLSSFPKNKYFSIYKEKSEFRVERTSVIPNLLGITFMKPCSLMKNLNASERIVFCAILTLQKLNKPFLTRTDLAARTGFKLRQVAYALQSLVKRKLLIHSSQKEQYVRNSKEGKIRDTRIRKVYKIPEAILQIIPCKIAPLKGTNRYPVNTNGYLGKGSSQKSFSKSDFLNIWDLYLTKFKQTSFEERDKIWRYLQKNVQSQDWGALPAIIQQAARSSFLKRANQHGWQEAVVASYSQKGCKLSDASRHINGYKNHRPGFLWILQHQAAIRSGQYQEKPLSYKQQQWNQRLFASLPNPSKKESGSTSVPLNPDIIRRAIQAQDSFSPVEKRLRLWLMEKVGAGAYQSWIKPCKLLLEDKGKALLKTPNKFFRDMLYQKIILPGREIFLRETTEGFELCC